MRIWGNGRHTVTSLLAVFALVGVFLFVSVAGYGLTEERKIRKLELLSMPAGEDLAEFRATQLYANMLNQLGLNVEHHPLSWSVLGDYVWQDRQSWDMTAWYMTARPERSDPHELLYNSFHSSTREGGYNFFGYKNPKVDELLDQQIQETDRAERKKLVYEIEEILAEDVAIAPTVHRTGNYAYDKNIWAPESIVNQAGMGLRNYWTFTGAEPLTDQTNMLANYAEDIRAINPFDVSGVADMWVIELIYDRLMRVGPDGLPKPGAAREVNWKDDTTLEVFLREDMKFHDGEPVTAEDVKFTYDAIRKSGEIPEYEPFAKPIEEIDIVNEHKLVFHLKQPNAAFLTTSLAKISIVPQHIWEPVIEDFKEKPEDIALYQRENPIGSGPFEFVSWKRGAQVTLQAVKSHHHSPQIDKLVFQKIGNPEVALGQLKKGAINFLTDYRGNAGPLHKALDESETLKGGTIITLGVRFFAFNMRRAPFDDKAFRKALAYALPRKAIRDTVEHGYTETADSIVSKALEYWHNPDLPDYQFNIAKAREILEEAGYEWDDQGNLYYPPEEEEELELAWGP